MQLQSWTGKALRADILYSQAGIAQHVLVSGDDGSVLVDAGDGVVRDLLSNGAKLGSIFSIAITHGHFDHIGGLYSLLGFMRMIGREEGLSLIFPEGCSEVTSLVGAFVSTYRTTMPFALQLIPATQGQRYTTAGMTLQGHPMVHCGSISGMGILDPIPAMGYRISCKGEAIAITGDTGLCPEVEVLVSGADLAIIEATYATRRGISEEELRKVHLCEEDAARIGSLARDYILVHKDSAR